MGVVSIVIVFGCRLLVVSCWLLLWFTVITNTVTPACASEAIYFYWVVCHCERSEAIPTYFILSILLFTNTSVPTLPFPNFQIVPFSNRKSHIFNFFNFSNFFNLCSYFAIHKSYFVNLTLNHSISRPLP